MIGNVISEDLRSIKTERALNKSMLSLLKTVSFKKITVKVICEDALVSRAAFYAHFIDKYDLLKYCMKDIWTKNYKKTNSLSQMEELFNTIIRQNTKVIKNLLLDADNETLDIVFEFIVSTINLKIKKNTDEDMFCKNIVLSSFYAGGIISYFIWQIKNMFPPEVQPMNKYVYEIIEEFISKTK